MQITTASTVSPSSTTPRPESTPAGTCPTSTTKVCSSLCQFSFAFSIARWHDCTIAETFNVGSSTAKVDFLFIDTVILAPHAYYQSSREELVCSRCCMLRYLCCLSYSWFVFAVVG